MRIRTLLAVAFCVIASVAHAVPSATPKPRPPDPFIKNTVWSGTVAAMDARSITVTNERALTRMFLVHSGTIYGRTGKGKLTDFKVGQPVVVSFSEITGSSQARAENISPPAAPRKRKPAGKP